MKNLKKLIKHTGFSFLFISTCIFLYACASVPKLSKEVVKAPPKEIIKSKTGFAISQGHSIWFENIPPKGVSKGAVILIMENRNDVLTW